MLMKHAKEMFSASLKLQEVEGQVLVLALLLTCYVTCDNLVSLGPGLRTNWRKCCSTHMPRLLVVYHLYKLV